MNKEGILKFILIGVVAIGALVFVAPKTQAATDAAFSFSSDKSSYTVGDDVTVTLTVDAGSHASTLSVIDTDLKISDPTIISPKNATSIMTPGAIFSLVGLQSYAAGVINVVIYIDPASPPASRSGIIGTITFKALKAGKATLTYDRINATDEDQEMDWIGTSATSIDITVADVAAATATPTPMATTTKTSSGGTTTKSSGTGTVQGTSTSANSATTGPVDSIIFALVSGMGVFLIYKIILRARKA